MIRDLQCNVGKLNCEEHKFEFEKEAVWKSGAFFCDVQSENKLDVTGTEWPGWTG